MKKRKLGAGGPEVSAIGLGCMSFAGFFGETDLETSVACLDTAWAAGIDPMPVEVAVCIQVAIARRVVW